MAHSLQQTSTVLPRIVTWIGLAPSSPSQAAQVVVVMTHTSMNQMFKEHHGVIGAAVRFFSDLTVERNLPESSRRSPVGLPEGGAEMTVAGEAEIQAQGR